MSEIHNGGVNMGSKDITYRSDFDVELVQLAASDDMVSMAARVSTQGSEARSTEDDAGLINFLMRNRHGSPFEHGLFTWKISAPIFVWREFMRHRIASFNEQCLSGSTQVVRMNPNGSVSHKRNASLETIWRNWHEGVHDSLGRTRKLTSCRNILVRSFDESTHLPVISRVKDVVRRGVQTTWLVQTESGREIRATKSHLFLTPDGWSRLGELSVGSHLLRAGKLATELDPVASPDLRRGISQWVAAVRRRMAVSRLVFECAGCRGELLGDEIELDHIIPVIKDLSLALTESNLQVLCEECHGEKTNREQALARRGTYVSLRADRIASISEPMEEMTYDLVLEGPNHNFLGNELVVHNSGRYMELEPVFYMPSVRRPLRQVGKAGAYSFVPGTVEQISLVDEQVERACLTSWGAYQTMLGAGVAREVARIVLPLTVYSTAFVTMNPRGLMNFLSLRTKREGSAYPSYPMQEISRIADEMENALRYNMPITWAAFNDNGRVQP